MRASRFLGAVGAGVMMAQLGAAAAFRRRVRGMIHRLGAAVPADARPSVPAIALEFAARALAADHPLRTVHLQQSAIMRMGPNERWLRLTAEETIAIREPNFVWLARMWAAPFVRAAILDSYVAGKGRLELRLFGSLPLMRARGPEIDRGEAMRYLAELPWAPDAILHNPRLVWRQIDVARVEVSTQTANGPARVRLCFEGGDIVRIEADDRPRAVGDGIVATPWYGRFCDYREIGGRRIPAGAAVGWRLQAGAFEYWRGEVTGFAVA